MKHCVRIVLTAALLLTIAFAKAQTPVSSSKTLFHQYPEVISCTAAQLEKLFSAEKNGRVRLDLPGMPLEGTLTHRFSRYNQLETIGIQLPAFDQILLSVTRRYDADRQPVYAAQLLSSRYADGYLLNRQKDGSYRFSKISSQELMPVCSH